MIEERRKLEQDIRDGKIFESIPQTGMGRGAAMTLPAWMTEVSTILSMEFRERQNKVTFKKWKINKGTNVHYLALVCGN